MKLTEQEWRQRLSDEEFRVTRQKGTERPFTGELLNNEALGDYVCRCCGEKLFDAEDKFDAGCGCGKALCIIPTLEFCIWPDCSCIIKFCIASI